MHWKAASKISRKEILQNNNKMKADFSAIVGSIVLFCFCFVFDEQEWGQKVKVYVCCHESYCTCCVMQFFRQNSFFFLQFIRCFSYSLHVACEILTSTSW